MRFILFPLLFFLTLTAYAGPHTIQRGETFEDIALLYGIPVDSLLKANLQTEARTGLTIEVPLPTLVYDLGESALFRTFHNKRSSKDKKGMTLYRNAYKKQQNLYRCSHNKRAAREMEIVALYEKAISYGNLYALFQLGRYKIHGRFYSYDGYPNFQLAVNENVEELTQGVEYLQIAALVGNNENALVELALACAYEKSPIRNPYLCLGLLEYYRNTLHFPVNDLLVDMYENGYGVDMDYLKAYTLTSSALTDKNGTTHREQILRKIEALSENFKSAKYGVGLKPEMLLSIAFSHFHDGKMDVEGLFWLHRAARLGEADASWALASILKKEQYPKNCVDGDIESQVLYFANEAAEGGKQEAKDYIASYEKYKKQLEEREAEIARQNYLEKKERRERRRQMWLNVAGTVLQAAAQTYVAVETAKQMQNNQNALQTIPQMSASPMFEDQWLAHNQLAMQQLAQYTINKSIADWNGVPMAPTDMSAVNFGTDMTPGSPLWMWNQQQELNRMSTTNARMQWELLSFYERQADQVEQQIMTNPLQPVSGILDSEGFYVSPEMLGTDNNSNAAREKPKNDVVEKAKEYYAQRYGDVECNMCHGDGVCHTCNGHKYNNNGLGASGGHECPNCWKEYGHSTGKCGKCQGKGFVYGLK